MKNKLAKHLIEKEMKNMVPGQPSEKKKKKKKKNKDLEAQDDAEIVYIISEPIGCWTNNL